MVDRSPDPGARLWNGVLGPLLTRGEPSFSRTLRLRRLALRSQDDRLRLLVDSLNGALELALTILQPENEKRLWTLPIPPDVPRALAILRRAADLAQVQGPDADGRSQGLLEQARRLREQAQPLIVRLQALATLEASLAHADQLTGLRAPADLLPQALPASATLLEELQRARADLDQAEANPALSPPDRRPTQERQLLDRVPDAWRALQIRIEDQRRLHRVLSDLAGWNAATAARPAGESSQVEGVRAGLAERLQNFQRAVELLRQAVPQAPGAVEQAAAQLEEAIAVARDQVNHLRQIQSDLARHMMELRAGIGDLARRMTEPLAGIGDLTVDVDPGILAMAEQVRSSRLAEELEGQLEAVQRLRDGRPGHRSDPESGSGAPAPRGPALPPPTGGARGQGSSSGR